MPAMMIKVTKDRLSNQVYTILKGMIANYRFSPGTRLNVEQIAKEVGASRTPVWEAVHRLVQEGLLENIPNRGVFMCALTPKQAIELYTVRESLEALAARLAIQNIDEKIMEKMKKSLEQQYKVVQKEDLVSYSRLDFDFHALVYEASGNRTLQEMLETIKNKMRPIAMHITPILSSLYHDHVEILEAFEEKNPDKAEAAFRKHNHQMIVQIQSSMETDEWKEAPKSSADLS
ncbi:MAG: GntR family transcriptional regulator [Deltaproteobacteria bacterium]|nr:GntR family transcriptional regulator [Deltaproteobacteria bacterium]